MGKNAELAEGGERSELYIITVAYNHPRLIKKQIEQLKRYVRDDGYRHIVVDNSPCRKIRQQIKETCEREQVDYVGMPPFIDNMISHRLFGNGLSHGAALNWMYYHILKTNKPDKFVLLDHDVFPFKECSLMDRLGDRDFCGVERNTGEGWYLWPGWCLFRYDAIEKCKPNFLPVFAEDVYLDSGGGNYERLYCHYELKDVDFPDVETKRIKKTEGLHSHNDIYHGDCIQYIDHTWLHIINGSNCAHIQGKEKFVDYIIDNLEKFYE